MSYRMVIATFALFLFAAPGASAQSQDEQSACMGDAFSVCGHAIPDRSRVAACLADNMSRLSPGCRAVMARYNPAPGRANRYANERRTAPDRERYEEPRSAYQDSYRDPYRDPWAQRAEPRSYDDRGGWSEPDHWRTR